LSLFRPIVIVSVFFQPEKLFFAVRIELGPGLVIIIAYLLGSIPFGYLIVRAARGGDIREIGSGGTGATNVSRRAGKAAGLLTLLLDAAKGAAAVLIAKLLLGLSLFAFAGNGGSPFRGLGGLARTPVPNAAWWIAGAAIGVIVGHIFPVWLGFRGGKGVATGVGVFVLLVPLAVLLAAIVFVLVVWRTRYISLGSIVGAATIPIVVLVQDSFIRPVPNGAPLMMAAIAGAALIVFAHRANIGRLVQGNESRFR
jgi:glycerol-3-phosphate acyltransferase PlsY